MIKEFNSAEQSSTIHSSRYNTETLELEVHFKSGISYLYLEVPNEVFDTFELSESKGKSFAILILNNYEYIRQNSAPTN